MKKYIGLALVAFFGVASASAVPGGHDHKHDGHKKHDEHKHDSHHGDHNHEKKHDHAAGAPAASTAAPAAGQVADTHK